MIFSKSEAVPYETTGGLDTVAVRFPSDKVAQAFIRAAGGFVAAPSANVSGRPSPTSGKHVFEDLQGKIEMLLDSGICEIGLESTIVDMTEDIPVILRPGYVTEEMLEEVLSRIEVDRTILSNLSGAPKAPGMKYRHYAPKGELVIVKSVGKRTDEAAVARRLYGILREFDEEGAENIYSEAFDCNGMGHAIMNRLLKAAGHHIINV